MVWTDGSCTLKEGEVDDPLKPDMSNVSGAWIVTCNGQKITSNSIRLGRATAYDGEMAALKGGFAAALRNAPAIVKTIRVFVDNVAAANAIVCLKKGPSMMQAVSVCKRIQTFLNEDKEWQVIIQWCLSHIGIKCNEEVDELAGKSAKEDGHPADVSFARAKSDILREANGEWTVLVQKGPEYMGHDFLKTRVEVKLGKVTKRNFFLSQWAAEGCNWDRGKGKHIGADGEDLEYADSSEAKEYRKQRRVRLLAGTKKACEETARLCRFWSTLR